MLKASLPSGHFDGVHQSKLVDAAKQLLKDYTLPPFLVGITYPRSFSEQKQYRLKQAFQFPLTKALEKSLDSYLDFSQPKAQLHFDLDKRILNVVFEPLYLQGRYQKHARGVAQTLPYCPECKGTGCAACNQKGLLEEDSVEVFLSDTLVPAFGAAGMKFHGMGREDKDVLMLGKGRPFVVELLDPRSRKASLSALQKQVTNNAKGKIEITSLAPAKKKDVARVKEARPDKVYQALVSFTQEPADDAMQALVGTSHTVEQRTPSRVAARRADKVRTRHATLQKLEKKDAARLLLTMRTDAGLYVKEFISGDEMRTKPSLTSLLGVSCTCEELDVLEVLDEYTQKK